jgi:uncharacterized protein
MPGPLPPVPFGLSAESTYRIDRDGGLWHDGERVTHPGLARALASWVDVDEATGRYVLRNAINWCYVAVDDAPLVVTSAGPAPDGGLVLALSDGTTAPLDPATLRVDEDDGVYCAVRDGRIPARFLRQAAFAVLDRVHPAPDGEGLLLELAGRVHPVPRVPRGEGSRR